MKGCEVYFPETFSWTSPLSDRKIPSSTKISKTRLSYLVTADLGSRVLNQMVHLMPWITATHLRHFLYSGPANKPSLWARDRHWADIECLGDFCPDLLRHPLCKPTSHPSHYRTRLQKNFHPPILRFLWGNSADSQSFTWKKFSRGKSIRTDILTCIKIKILFCFDILLQVCTYVIKPDLQFFLWKWVLLLFSKSISTRIKKRKLCWHAKGASGAPNCVHVDFKLQ